MDTFLGTVGLALCWLVLIGVMLAVARKALSKPVHTDPQDVVDRLGALCERPIFKGKVPTLTEQERHAVRARLYLISNRAGGRARIATFPVPKDVA